MNSRVTIGIALGESSLTASWVDGRSARRWHGTMESIAATELRLDVMRSAFAELRLAVGAGARVALSIAILPPLARVRHVVLPRMSNDERRLALSHAAERHFLGLGESVLCAVERLGRGTRSAVPFLAAAVPAGLIADITALTTELGWKVDRILPAHSAWLTAALERWPSVRRGRACIIVEGDAETTVLQLNAGSLTLVRRVRVCDPTPTSADGDSEIERKVIPSATGEAAPAAIAAHHAMRARWLEIVPDAERKARDIRDIRFSRRLVIAAVACIIAAAGVYRWSLARQLDAVAAERAMLRARVERAIAAHDSLAELGHGTAAIESLEQSAPRWSAVLSRIAIELPPDVLVDVFRGDADSVTMQGQATNASGVFSALRGTQGVVSVRSNAPIQQELLAGHESSERWTLTLHVAHAAAARDGK